MKFFRCAVVPIFSLVVLPSLGFEGDRVQVRLPQAKRSKSWQSWRSTSRPGRSRMQTGRCCLPPNLIVVSRYVRRRCTTPSVMTTLQSSSFPRKCREYDDFSRTLEAWKKADLRAGGERVLKYLPGEATIHVKVFP